MTYRVLSKPRKGRSRKERTHGVYLPGFGWNREAVEDLLVYLREINPHLEFRLAEREKPAGIPAELPHPEHRDFLEDIAPDDS